MFFVGKKALNIYVIAYFGMCVGWYQHNAWGSCSICEVSTTPNQGHLQIMHYCLNKTFFFLTFGCVWFNFSSVILKFILNHFNQKSLIKIICNTKWISNILHFWKLVTFSSKIWHLQHKWLFLQLLSSDDLWMYAPIAYNGMDIGLNPTTPKTAKEKELWNGGEDRVWCIINMLRRKGLIFWGI